MFHWSQTIWRCFCRYRTQIWRKTVSHMQLHYLCRKKNSCVSWNKINELDLTKRYLKMNVHIFGNSVFVLVTVKIIFYTIAYRKIFSFYFYSQNWNKFKHVTLATLKVYLSGIKNCIRKIDPSLFDLLEKVENKNAVLGSCNLYNDQYNNLEFRW